MYPFTFVRAEKQGEIPPGRLLAGGTTLIDLMKLEVERPSHLVDINALPLKEIESSADGSIRIGALVTNSELAGHPAVTGRFPLLAEAILSGASPQIRNMATTSGNILQRTRCYYFRDVAMACNKRTPGSGCAAIGGHNRIHAVLGTSEHCIAAHPSDMCVALAALDAVVLLSAGGATRRVPLTEFHLLPEDHPEVETVMRPGELIAGVELPPHSFGTHFAYVKVRDRASFSFALASAAVALELSGGIVRSARIALGGVATKPWRAREAEAELAGKRANRFAAAAALAVKGAVPREHNAFKIELAKRTVIRALEVALER